MPSQIGTRAPHAGIRSQEWKNAGYGVNNALGNFGARLSGDVTLVELQPFSAIDFRVCLTESFANGIWVYLVLFNEPMHGFLYERIGIVIVATLDLLADAPFQFRGDVPNLILGATQK